MTILSFLYTLIIAPLELLFEVIFVVANRVIGNEGLSIIFLSLAVNFLVLPLYKRADELQAEERDIQAKMAERIKRTKQTFKGDERFMMLQEYYRINKYKPIYALKSSASLLLQIPFFIAAYRLLSGMQSLQGMSFGFITDLGKEDATFMIGSFPVNILPIVMTLINIVTGIIYTKGHPIKSKIQVYGLAVVFLVLLYHSPAGLVFYWLLNNVFSLVKNVFYKLKNPKKVLSIVLAVTGGGLLFFTLFNSAFSVKRKCFLILGCFLLALPLIIIILKQKIKLSIKLPDKKAKFYMLGASLMALITGLLIPSAVISNSAEEFIDVMHPYYSPLLYIGNSLVLAVGCFVLWGGVFYFFMGDKGKTLFSVGIWALFGVAIVDYMFFGTNLGTMSSTLQFDAVPSFSRIEYLINALVILIAASALVFVGYKFPNITKTILAVGILTVSGIGIYNSYKVIQSYNWFKENSQLSSEVPHFSLNKNGKNVVVIMLDRAMGTQAPYIFNEKPELMEQFDGFTYYPNTVSYGAFTNFGTPPIFGGYDYTPERMNERSSESLMDKHNESLKVMPDIFDKNGYEVTVCDPSYAGYKWIPDLSIYDEYKSDTFNCYITEGFFDYYIDVEGDDSQTNTFARVNEIRNRDFFMYSIMKISPVIIQKTIYNEGLYNESVSVVSSIETSAFNDGSSGIAVSYSSTFLNSYAVLKMLPEMTVIDDSSCNTFMMMTNHMTHESFLLQEPDYVPSEYVDNSAYDTDMVARYTVDGVTMEMNDDLQIQHYHVNMGSYILLGAWFDYLRENDVYDNTRIIIVSDHGRGLNQFDIFCNDQDMEFLMPLLMVKDFDATGFTVCDDFMTNADTPALAMEGLIEDPVNPFTGNPIDSDAKNEPQTLFLSYDWDVEVNNGNTFLPGGWYVVDGDPHDPGSWTYVGTH